jgi:hypothetical protein
MVQNGFFSENAFFGHQAGISGNPIQNAEVVGFFDLCQIGGVDEKLHGTKLATKWACCFFIVPHFLHHLMPSLVYLTGLCAILRPFENQTIMAFEGL